MQKKAPVSSRDIKKLHAFAEGGGTARPSTLAPASRASVNTFLVRCAETDVPVACTNPDCDPILDCGTRLQCARCGAKYCGSACQKAHWKAHKAVCAAPTAGQETLAVPDKKADARLIATVLRQQMPAVRLAMLKLGVQPATAVLSVNIQAMRTRVHWRTPVELQSDAQQKPALASPSVLKWVQQRAAAARAGAESELGTVPVVLASNRFQAHFTNTVRRAILLSSTRCSTVRHWRTTCNMGRHPSRLPSASSVHTACCVARRLGARGKSTSSCSWGSAQTTAERRDLACVSISPLIVAQLRISARRVKCTSFGRTIASGAHAASFSPLGNARREGSPARARPA